MPPLALRTSWKIQSRQSAAVRGKLTQIQQCGNCGMFQIQNTFDLATGLAAPSYGCEAALAAPSNGLGRAQLWIRGGQGRIQLRA